MISYSDHILANKPYAYWRLNDSSLAARDEDAFLLDCSGNERHLTRPAVRKDDFTHVMNFPASKEGTLYDSLPVHGMKVSKRHVGDKIEFPRYY